MAEIVVTVLSFKCTEMHNEAPEKINQTPCNLIGQNFSSILSIEILCFGSNNHNTPPQEKGKILQLLKQTTNQIFIRQLIRKKK
jgi:hypothetical protein